MTNNTEPERIRALRQAKTDIEITREDIERLLTDIQDEFKAMGGFLGNNNDAKKLTEEWTSISAWMEANYPRTPTENELVYAKRVYAERLNEQVAVGLGYKIVKLYDPVPEWTRTYFVDNFGNDTGSFREYRTPNWHEGMKSEREIWLNAKGNEAILKEWTTRLEDAIQILRHMPKGSFSIDQYVYDLSPSDIALKICEMFVHTPDVERRIKGNG